MLKKILNDVVVIIAGKQAEGIVDLLSSNQYVNEFLIAKKLNITINQTRNILYKISDKGLVSFMRKKDKKKGWYTYFWKIEPIKALEFYRNELLAKIDQINHQIKNRETRQFYYCPLCHIEVNEENALLRDFTCTECGNVYTLLDNTPILNDLRKGLNRLQSDLKEVDEEIRIETEKVLKSNAKIKKRDLKRENIKKEAKKVARKALKKASSAKSIKPKKEKKVSQKKAVPKKIKEASKKKVKTKKR